MTNKNSLTQFLADKLTPQRLSKQPNLRRWFWRAVKWCKPRGVLRVPVGDFRLWVDCADPKIGYSLIKRGVWEPEESSLFCSFVKEGDVVVDIGANIGYYTVLAGRLGAQVMAFEPEPDNLDLLRRNIRENDIESRVQVHDCALGEKTGSMTLHIDAGNHGGHSFSAGNILKDGGSLDVPVARLDDVVAASGKQVAVIKMDTQGAEAGILAGALQTLRRDRPVLLTEFWPCGLKKGGSGAAAVLTTLAELNYSFGLFDAVRGQWQPQSQEAILASLDEEDADASGTLVAVANKA